MQPLLWTTRSLRNLVNALAAKGHKVSPTVVSELLRDMGYSLQANSKTREGTQHIDRDAQFQYINTQAMVGGFAARCSIDPAVRRKIDAVCMKFAKRWRKSP